MPEHNPNRLLVEGDEDKRVIPQLIEANGIRWGERNQERIVEIKAAGGIEKLLETFLAYLVPDKFGALWAYAQEVLVEARNRAADYSDAHRDKAAIHTWLAWQDPPGCQLHHAVLQRVLDPRSPLTRPFIDWFRRLYEL